MRARSDDLLDALVLGLVLAGAIYLQVRTSVRVLDVQAREKGAKPRG